MVDYKALDAPYSSLNPSPHRSDQQSTGDEERDELDSDEEEDIGEEGQEAIARAKRYALDPVDMPE